MQFFSTAVSQLGTIVIGLGAGLGVWGVINLLEGYGNDNPGAKSQGMHVVKSMTLQEIAMEEGTCFQAIHKSIVNAKKKLREVLKKRN